MNKKFDAKRGFTLVELLAVIVVLAIVMLIALQAVLPAMDSARRQTFAIEANGAIDAANTYFMSSMWVPDAGGVTLPIGDEEVCIGIKKLYDLGYTELNPDHYSGKVVVKKKGNNYLYTVYIQKDNKMMVNGEGNDGNYNVDITENNVFDYDKDGFDGSCSTDGEGY